MKVGYRSQTLIKMSSLIVGFTLFTVMADAVLPVPVLSVVRSVLWLPQLLMAIVIALAWQFGQARLMLASLLVFGYLTIPNLASAAYFTYLYNQIGPAVVFVALIAMLFDKERGLSAYGVSTALGKAALIGLGVLAIIAIIHSLSITWIVGSQTAQPILALGKADGAVSWVFLATTVAGLVGLSLSPSNRHVALFLTGLTLVSLSITKGSVHGQAGLAALPVLIAVLIMIDSHNMAFKDELTGIKGRRALTQYVESLGKKYVVVMGDVDHFKKFNDTYGHDVGDQVLRMVARKIDAVGGGGKAFRFGGEKFTVIFANKTPAEAKPFVEVIRETIEQYEFVLRGDKREQGAPEDRNSELKSPLLKVRVTCSFGISERNETDIAFEDVMKSADSALYKAKAAGRNCVQIY